MERLSSRAVDKHKMSNAYEQQTDQTDDAAQAWLLVTQDYQASKYEGNWDWSHVSCKLWCVKVISKPVVIKQNGRMAVTAWQNIHEAISEDSVIWGK